MAERGRDERLSAALLRLAKDREDEGAWRDLFGLLWPFVFGTTYRFLRGRPDLAEDAAQEVFVRLAQYAPFEELQGPAALRSYAWVTARNVTRTLGRTQARRKERPLADALDEVAEMSQAQGAEDRVALREAVEHLFGQLTAEDSAILRLLLQGANLKEIAAETGRSYSDVAVRLHRLRARLRAGEKPDSA